MNTVSLRHVSALKGPPSGSMTDSFQQQGQQNELPDVQVSLYAAHKTELYIW